MSGDYYVRFFHVLQPSLLKGLHINKTCVALANLQKSDWKSDLPCVVRAIGSACVVDFLIVPPPHLTLANNQRLS